MKRSLKEESILQFNSINHIQLLFKPNVVDVAGQHVRENAQKYLQLNTGKVKSGKIFSVIYDLSPKQLGQFANESLRDPIIHNVYTNALYNDPAFQSYILISKLPGVTDDEGVSAQKALCDLLNIPFDFSAQWIFTQEIYYIENHLSNDQLSKLGEEMLGNPLINHFEYGAFDGKIKYIPTVHIESDTTIKTIDIFVDEAELEKLSKDLLLALDLTEMVKSSTPLFTIKTQIRVKKRQSTHYSKPIFINRQKLSRIV
ncbi:MAG: hypothetical protein P8X42_08955 [Calditrichaceae bacterium]